MSQQKRKAIRRPLHAAAFLYTKAGWPICACELEDVSQAGAKLLLSTIEELPKELIVSLSRDGKVRRHCEVAWSNGNRVGVRFKVS
jgi:hypothetical protein